MKKITLLSAILFGIAFTACKNNPKKDKSATENLKEMIKNSPGLNKGSDTYSITAPQGWNKSDTVLYGVKITTIKSPLEGLGDNFMENITCVTESARNYDLKKYAEQNKESMQTQMAGVRFLSEKELTIGDNAAIAMVYNFKYSVYDLKNTAYFLVKNNTGYVLTCSAVYSKFNKFQSVFTECIKSFTIKNR